MYKILTHIAHASYQSNLSKIPNTEYYHIVSPTKGLSLEKAWDNQNPKPDNIFEISLDDAQNRLGEFDFMLIHSHPYLNVFKDWKIKKVFVEHTAPYPDGGFQQRHWGKIRSDVLDHTVFITSSNLEAWGEKEDDKNSIILHAMDVENYPKYNAEMAKSASFNYIMTIVNAFIERDWCCGYILWHQCIWPFPDVRVYGYGNENLGRKYCKGAVPHGRILELLQTAGVYFNPSTASPIPMSLLEAMAVGVPVVTTAAYEPGRVMKSGVHGIVSDDPVELREGLELMLKDRNKAIEMGQNARELVKEKFSLDSFVLNWQGVFNKV